MVIPWPPRGCPVVTLRALHSRFMARKPPPTVVAKLKLNAHSLANHPASYAQVAATLHLVLYCSDPAPRLSAKSQEPKGQDKT